MHFINFPTCLIQVNRNFAVNPWWSNLSRPKFLLLHYTIPIGAHDQSKFGRAHWYGCINGRLTWYRFSCVIEVQLQIPSSCRSLSFLSFSPLESLIGAPPSLLNWWQHLLRHRFYSRGTFVTLRLEFDLIFFTSRRLTLSFR